MLDDPARVSHRSKSKSKSRSRSRGSGKNKQLQTYDPAFAGIQQAGQAGQRNSGQAGSTRGEGNPGVGNNNPVGRGNPLRNPPHVQGNPQREVASVPQQAVIPAQDRLNDGNSRLQQLGYQPDENPLGSRIGTRQLNPADARFRLDRIHQSELVEEQDLRDLPALDLGSCGNRRFGTFSSTEVPRPMTVARSRRTG